MGRKTKAHNIYVKWRKNIPSETFEYFYSKGRLLFNKMYKEAKKADYLLINYMQYIGYNTTDARGNFQSAYGIKPVVIAKRFTLINKNSIAFNPPPFGKITMQIL